MDECKIIPNYHISDTAIFSSASRRRGEGEMENREVNGRSNVEAKRAELRIVLC